MGKVTARIRELHAKQVYERAKRDAKIIQELESIAFADQNSASGLPITTKEKLSALSDLAKIAGLTTDFNLALAGLRKYGLVLIPKISEDNANIRWELLDKNQIRL